MECKRQTNLVSGQRNHEIYRWDQTGLNTKKQKSRSYGITITVDFSRWQVQSSALAVEMSNLTFPYRHGVPNALMFFFMVHISCNARRNFICVCLCTASKAKLLLWDWQKPLGWLASLCHWPGTHSFSSCWRCMVGVYDHPCASFIVSAYI